MKFSPSKYKILSSNTSTKSKANATKLLSIFKRKKRTVNGRKELLIRPYLKDRDVWMTEEELTKNKMKDSELFTELHSHVLEESKKRYEKEISEARNAPPATATNKKTDSPEPAKPKPKPKPKPNPKPPLKRLGTLKIEVIELAHVKKCDLLLGKSDPYCILAFEDQIFRTVAIPSSLSPVFPSYARRACIFEITSSCSTLHVGAFDEDESMLDDDDPLGRIGIKLTSLRANTIYDAHYPLQNSELKQLKGERGYIHLRYVLNWEGNEKAAIMQYLSPPNNGDSFYIATEDRKMWRGALYAIHGEQVSGAYDWKIFLAYVNELKSYIAVFQEPLTHFLLDTIFYQGPLARSLFLFLR